MSDNEEVQLLPPPLLTDWDDDERFEPDAAAQNGTLVEEPGDELVAEMAREEAREEERRNAAAGLKPKKEKKPARPKAVDKDGNPVAAKKRARRANFTPGPGASKIQKMLAKHKRTAMRDAERIIESAVHDNESEDVRKVRVEAQHAQQMAIAAARELRALTASATKTKEALKIHADLSVKLRRLKAMTTSTSSTSTATTSENKSTPYEAMSEMILDDCIEAISGQAATITLLHDRVNKLVRLYSENTAKCEATTRRFFDASVQFSSAIPIANRPTPASDANAIAHAPQEAPRNNGEAMFSLRTGNGFMELTTRAAPQITRGTPGAHYIWHSIARRKGSVQQLSQSNAITRTHTGQA